jgi:hypothetical protein
MTVTSGTEPYLASSGAFRFLPSATDSTYAVVPLTPNIGAGGGTHTYTKMGPNTAQLSLSDLDNGPLVATTTFKTASSGTFVVVSVQVPSIQQAGTFTMFYGPSPTNLAGLEITVAITSGRSPFAGIGSYRFIPAREGNTYAVEGISQVDNSTGTYAYIRNSTNTGVLAFTDSLAGAGQSGQMSFDTANSGTLLILNSGLSGYQTGTFTVSTRPPIISADPQTLTVVTGTGATFSAVASGAGVLTYQWRRNGVDISGANAAAYTISSVTINDVGNYQLVASNAGGSATSVVATLTVSVPPSFTSQPQSLTRRVDESATLSSQATGTAPLSFQWRKEGSPLAGATNATFTISGVQGTDAGGYSVVVTNAAGSVTSTNANLVVDLSATLSPRLTAVSWDRTNGFKQKADVQAGRAYRLQYSTNLPAWFDQTNFVAPEATMDLWDKASTDATRRFYRIVSP